MRAYLKPFLLLPLIVCGDLFAQDKDYFIDARAVYVNYNQDRYWADGEAFVTSLKLGYKKEIVDNLEAGIAFGGIADFGINGSNKTNNTYIYDADGDTFALLHQAYLKYSYEKSFIEVGRFEFTSPLIDSDDYFVLSNSFEGANANINLDKTNIKLGHISAMSGSWDTGGDGSKFDSMSKTPWMHKSDKVKSQWSFPATDFGVGDEGISFLGVDYKNNNYKFQVWDYYAHEFMNSIYAQLDLKVNNFDISFQYNTFDSVGKVKEASKTNHFAIIDYDVWGAKIATKIDDIGVSLNYTGVSENESAHLWGSWGGYPYFASGMMVTYFDTSLRDAHIYSLNTDFSLVKNLNTTVHIGYYDLNSDYTIYNGSNVNTPDGEDYIYTYGVSNSYKYSDELSFVFKLAGREFESGDKATLIRSILKYSF